MPYSDDNAAIGRDEITSIQFGIIRIKAAIAILKLSIPVGIKFCSTILGVWSRDKRCVLLTNNRDLV